MNAYSYPFRLGDRRNGLDEISVVIPNLLPRINAAVGQRSLENLVVPRAGVSLGQIETARRCSASSIFTLRAPDAIAI